MHIHTVLYHCTRRRRSLAAAEISLNLFFFYHPTFSDGRYFLPRAPAVRTDGVLRRSWMRQLLPGTLQTTVALGPGTGVLHCALGPTTAGLVAAAAAAQSSRSNHLAETRFRSSFVSIFHRWVLIIVYASIGIIFCAQTYYTCPSLSFFYPRTSGVSVRTVPTTRTEIYCFITSINWPLRIIIITAP